MTCYRCGYCCVMYDVIIIHPDCIKENLNIDELPFHAFVHKQNGFTCPYLKWENNTAICCIHHYKWFQETPCYSHNSLNNDCRLGKYIKYESKETFEKIQKMKYQNFNKEFENE